MVLSRQWIKLMSMQSQYKYVKVVIRLQMTDRSKWYGATVMEANRKGQEDLSKNVGANALARFFPSVFITSMTALLYFHHCWKLIFPFYSQRQHLSYTNWITTISSLLDFLCQQMLWYLKLLFVTIRSIQLMKCALVRENKSRSFSKATATWRISNY